MTARWQGISALALWGIFGAGCATGPRVVPVPSAGVVLDAAEGSATAGAEGVQVIVRPTAWRGIPWDLRRYVTPFHLLLANGSALPLHYDYPDLRLFDEARFQYTALPPEEVRRLFRWSGMSRGILLAANARVIPVHWRRRPHYWDPWWGPPLWPYSYPFSYPYYPPYPYYPYGPNYGPDDVAMKALPTGALQPGARRQGFVYFQRVRPEASRLMFEFHYRLGDAPRVLVVPFAIERAEERGHGRAAGLGGLDPGRF